jgi:hypothetical protein
VCGVVATLLVWGGEHGCDAVRGRPSCGGYGFFMLAGIIAACFVIGVVMLRALGAEHAGVITFFGLGLPLFVVLAFLLDYAFDTWMALALPMITGFCFVLAVYIARALDAANPSSYAEDVAAPTETDDQPATSDRDLNETRVDELPRYAPTDDR